MSTTLIQPRKNGADITKLTVKQQKFVMEVLATDSFDITGAARSAGYKTPPQAANKLMKNKAVIRALGKAMRERNERCQLKQDDVLNYLKTALFFNPLSLFQKSEDGHWLIEDLDSIPEEIGRLIEECEMKTVETEEGTKSFFKLKFVSHGTVLPLAMKHLGLLVEKTQLETTHLIDWDTLLSTSKNGKPKNSKLIEQTIIDVESTET